MNEVPLDLGSSQTQIRASCVIPGDALRDIHAGDASNPSVPTVRDSTHVSQCTSTQASLQRCCAVEASDTQHEHPVSDSEFLVVVPFPLRNVSIRSIF